MAPHSSTLAWQIPWTEDPGRLQSMGSLRVGYYWATSLSLSCVGEGNSNTLQCSCLENPRDGGAWKAAVYGVTQSRTQLKWLSSSSSIILIVKPDKNTTHTKSSRSVALLNIDAKIFQKIVVSQIQQYITRITHNDQMGFFPRM